MYLFIDENPNCSSEERMFAASGDKRRVDKVQISVPHSNVTTWCAVTGVDENGAFEPATAQRVEDSADGTAWLVFGGAWGLRFKAENDQTPWSLYDKHQWGVPFLVLDASGSSIHFQS